MGGGSNGARSSNGLQRQSSSSSDSAQVSYETDEEFATALSSYDIPQVADALRRYLAFEVQSRYVLFPVGNRLPVYVSIGT